MPTNILDINSPEVKKKLAELKSYSWFSLQSKSKHYVVTHLEQTVRFIANLRSLIDLYSKFNNLQNIVVKTQPNHQLLYFLQESFNTFFTSLEQSIPIIQPASVQLINDFEDKFMDEIKPREQAFLDNIPTFNWFCYKAPNHHYFIADLRHLAKNGINIANYHATAINRLAKKYTAESSFKASCLSSHHLLYFQDDSFENYFKALGLAQPIVSKAPKELVRDFNDKKLSKTSKNDENNVAKLKEMKWFHVDENNIQFVITVAEGEFNKLGHLSVSIAHIASSTGNGKIKSSVFKKHCMLYFTSEAFDELFKYLKEPKPSTELASETLKSHFAERRSSRNRENYHSCSFDLFLSTENVATESEVESSNTTPLTINHLEEQATILFRYNTTENNRLYPSLEVRDEDENTVTKMNISRILNPLTPKMVG